MNLLRHNAKRAFKHGKEIGMLLFKGRNQQAGLLTNKDP